MLTGGVDGSCATAALALVARQLAALLELLLGRVHSELVLCRPLRGLADNYTYNIVVPRTSMFHASTPTQTKNIRIIHHSA
jgi:hypothetical protein